MGSPFQLVVGDVEVIWGKNYLDDSFLLPFQSGDLVHEEAGGEPTRHVYQTPAATAARRLELLGYTMASARRAYERGVEALSDWEREHWPQRLLGPAGFSEWCRTIVEDACSVQAGRTGDPVDDHPPHWEETLLGFPNGSLGAVLRALVSVVPAATPVTLDLTDMLQGGWISDDDDPCRQGNHPPLIILTEGKSDSRLLGDALRTLHPELADFVRFIDYETANPQGGTDQLVQFVKMFVGCGIGNRIVVLFDNDAAGYQALGALEQVMVPDTVRVTTLPSLPMFASYPTEGPDGPASSDIDGRACALELYLGREALTDKDGQLRPVRWGGFNEKVKRYQGQVVGKDEVQKGFAEKLAEVRAGRARPADFDFTGVEAIFERVFEVLAEGAAGR